MRASAPSRPRSSAMGTSRPGQSSFGGTSVGQGRNPFGAVEAFDAPDGHPLRTGIRKKLVERLHLDFKGFPGDESAERDHHTHDKAVHLFSDEYYADLEAHVAAALP